MSDVDLRTIVCSINETDRRLDRIVRKNLPSMPLSLIHKSIRTGLITINGSRGKPGYRLKKDDVIGIPASILPATTERPGPSGPPLDISTILFENEHLIFINKKAGMLAHGRNSLQLSLLTYLNESPDTGASFTPGPLHRLDRNTSGIICFGKTAPGARYFSGELQAGRIGKFYVAIVDGEVAESSIWRDMLVRDKANNITRVSGRGASKEALAEVHPVLCSRGKSLLLIRLLTGVTHQIRVQCAARGHPLTGDRKYGPSGSRHEQTYFLHAYALRFEKPGTFVSESTITAPLPGFHLEMITSHFGSTAPKSLFELAASVIES